MSITDLFFSVPSPLIPYHQVHHINSAFGSVHSPLSLPRPRNRHPMSSLSTIRTFTNASGKQMRLKWAHGSTLNRLEWGWSWGSPLVARKLSPRRSLHQTLLHPWTFRVPWYRRPRRKGMGMALDMIWTIEFVLLPRVSLSTGVCNLHGLSTCIVPQCTLVRSFTEV